MTMMNAGIGVWIHIINQNFIEIQSMDNVSYGTSWISTPKNAKHVVVNFNCFAITHNIWFLQITLTISPPNSEKSFDLTWKLFFISLMMLAPIKITQKYLIEIGSHSLYFALFFSIFGYRVFISLYVVYFRLSKVWKAQWDNIYST